MLPFDNGTNEPFLVTETLIYVTDIVTKTETTFHVAVALISCFLSFFGSLLIIITYWRYPQIRKPARKLLLWLSVCDLGTSVVYSLCFAACGSNCSSCSSTTQEIAAMLGIWFPVASFLWHLYQHLYWLIEHNYRCSTMYSNKILRLYLLIVERISIIQLIFVILS